MKVRATRGRRRPSPWTTLLACCLVTARVHADPAGQARFHDELARAHYKSGRYESALREFFLEQRVSPNPRISFNIALCFQELRRSEDAFQYFEEYVASSDDDAERRAYAGRLLGELKKSLALVHVESTPPGARIYVDRRELGSYGTTPKVIALAPGEHRVWTELDGHHVAAGTVSARRSETATVKLSLERILGRLQVTAPIAARATIRSPAGEMLGEGETPLQVEVPPGSYEVSVSAAGHLPWTSLTRVVEDAAASVAAAPQKAPAPTGSITVTSNAIGALVELDGEPAGFSPAVLPNVGVGSHRLRVASGTLVPWSGTVAVAKDERSWLTVSLEEPPEERVSPATWVAGGIGAAGIVAGGILFGLAAKTHQDFEDAPPGADRNALRERGMALNTAADVALISGAVALATAGVLYLTTKEVRGRPSAASISRGEQ